MSIKRNAIAFAAVFSLCSTLCPFFTTEAIANQIVVSKNASMKEHSLSKDSKHFKYLWKEGEDVPKDAKVYIYTPIKHNGRTVCIDAGHGDNSKAVAQTKKEKYYPVEDSKLKDMNTSMVGAKALGYGVEVRDTANVYDKKETEPEFTLTVAMLARDMLLDKGYKVVMTRNNKNQNISNGTRSVLAGETSDIMVSIHSNASNSHTAKGCIVYYAGDKDAVSGDTYPNYTKIMGIDKHSDKSKELSQYLVDSVSKKAGFNNKGAQTAVLRVFSYSSIPTALVEVGFSDQIDDAKLLINKKKEISEGIVYGIEEYYKHIK